MYGKDSCEAKVALPSVYVRVLVHVLVYHIRFAMDMKDVSLLSFPSAPTPPGVENRAEEEQGTSHGWRVLLIRVGVPGGDVHITGSISH